MATTITDMTTTIIDPPTVEVGHVEQSVFELPLRERSATPIGAGFFLRDRFADQLRREGAVGRRILHADKAGGNLHVEPAGGRLARRLPDEAKFLAAGVDQCFAARRGEQVPQRREVFDLQRIDNGQVLVGRELDQAKVGLKTVFGDEFRVVSDDRRRSDDLAEVPQLLVRNDVFVLHERLVRRA